MMFKRFFSNIFYKRVMYKIHYILKGLNECTYVIDYNVEEDKYNFYFLFFPYKVLKLILLYYT